MGLPDVLLMSVYYLLDAGGKKAALCSFVVNSSQECCSMSRVWLLQGLQLRHIHTGEEQFLVSPARAQHPQWELAMTLRGQCGTGLRGFGCWNRWLWLLVTWICCFKRYTLVPLGFVAAVDRCALVFVRIGKRKTLSPKLVWRHTECFLQK